MKYDLSKCNNLHWRISTDKGDKEGFIKLKDNGTLVTLYNEELFGIDSKSESEIRSIYGSADISVFYKIFHEEDFSIIPRDPNTYNDWQVGDYLKVNDTCQGGQVMALCGRMVAIKWIGKNAIEWLLRSWVNENCELRLTDYEKYIRDLKEEKPACPFKVGDRVLVRDLNSQEWGFTLYTTGYNWAQCIPLNGHTWHLLGTKDAYKENKEC